MTTARRHTPGRYRRDPAAIVPEAMASAWEPTHRQLVNLVIEVAHVAGWLVHVTEDSRTEHWGADSGWPDVFALGHGRAVAIELKVATGATVEQHAWLRRLSDVRGVDAYIMRSTGDRVRDASAIAGLLGAQR